MKTTGREDLAAPEPARWATIEKTPGERAGANLTSYELACAGFDWDEARFAMAKTPGGGVNLAYEAVDRHRGSELANAPALRWLGATGSRVMLTYAELAALSDRFANVLRGLAVRRGERVGMVLGRTPELYVAVLGAWKAGCVVVPLSSAMDSEPLRQRLALSGATTLITTVDRYRRTIAPQRQEIPALRHILLTDADIETAPLDGTLGLRLAIAAASAEFPIVHTQFEDPALLQFTAHHLGRPKAVVHVHGAVLAHRLTARSALDLRPRDIYWCTADPGTMTGISYGLIAPLSLGATVLSDEAEFDALRWYRNLTREQVTVWYTSTAALHSLRRLGGTPPPGTDLSGLRFAATTGEPLDPETVVWTDRVLGRPVHDNWSQDETGAILIANLACADIRPGSMGRPLPGVEATVLRVGERNAPADIEPTQAADGEVGELAIRAGWPSMFRGYWNEPERYARAFGDGWYLSGDLVRRDAEGYYWFVGHTANRCDNAGAGRRIDTTYWSHHRGHGGREG